MDAVDVVEGQPALAVVGDTEIAVFRVGSDVFAIDDLCSHAEASLSEGDQYEYIVECPRHGGRFDIRTGKARHFPAFSPIRTFPVKIEDGAIYVDAE
jgi:3-phenylpropionate/trans-cinnamate dioxygenase ferredoxin subunit